MPPSPTAPSPAGAGPDGIGAGAWVARLLAVALGLASGLDRLRFASIDRGWVPWGDDGAMVTVATRRFALLSEGLLAALGRPIPIGAPYPPLVALVGGITADATGLGLPGLLASQAVWAWAGAAAAILAGESMRAGWGGLLGAGLWVWMTQGTMLGDQFFAEPAVGGLALLTVVLLQRSRGLRAPLAAAGAGVAAGLGLLAKFTFATYIGPIAALWSAGSAAAAVARGRGPAWARALGGLGVFGGALWSVVLLAGWAKTGAGWQDLQAAIGVTVAVFAVFTLPKEWRVAAGLVLFVASAGGLAAVWYLPNRLALREFLTSNADRQYAGEPLPWSLALAYYARVVLRDTLDTPGLLLVAVGALRSLYKPVPAGLLGLFAAASGVALLAAAPYQSERYVAPAVALLVPVALAAFPSRAVPVGAVVAALASTFLLTTRLPAVHDPVAKKARLLTGETRIGQEPQSVAYERARVEAFLQRPWTPWPLQVTLRPPDPTAPPLLRAFRQATTLCPEGTPLRLIWGNNDLGMPLTSYSSWEPHPDWVIARPQPGDEVTLVVDLAPGETSEFTGKYVVRVEPEDPRCPG